MPLLPAAWKPRVRRVPFVRDYPLHFWTALRLGGGGRFPCGVEAVGPSLFTNELERVTCRRCIRSREVQALLRQGVNRARRKA
jgi:hypothetical protein